MFIKSALILGLVATVAIAAEDASTAEDPVSTFTATKVMNTLLPVSPFLTSTATLVVWTRTITPYYESESTTIASASSSA